MDPNKPWKNRCFENCTAKELQVPIFRDGKCVYDRPELASIRDYVQAQLDKEIWKEEQRFENPHSHYLDMTPDYYEMKMSLLYESRQEK